MPTTTATPLLKQKQALALFIRDSIAKRNLTQTEAAWHIKDAPSQLSLIVSGAEKHPAKYLRGFSLERLSIIASRFGADIRIVLQANPTSRKTGKITVVRD